MKITEYERGHQDAIRAAITWLHDEAKTMNDPHARDLLNSTAHGLGAAFAHPAAKERVKKAASHKVASLTPKAPQ